MTRDASPGDLQEWTLWRSALAKMDLAEVLAAAGRSADAAVALQKALDLYRRKGNTVSAARAEELLRRGLGARHQGGYD